MDKYKLLYNVRGQFEPGQFFGRYKNRQEASQIGAVLFGDDFRVALKVVEKNVKNKPKILET